MEQGETVFFLLVRLKSRKRLIVWLGAFIWVLAHKEKDADITSKTKSQPKQKGFRGFLLISHISTKLKKNLYCLLFTVFRSEAIRLSSLMLCMRPFPCVQAPR